MVITRLSDHGFKISQGSLNLALNPSSNKKNLTNGTFSADVILLSASQSGFDSAEHFESKSKDSFVISGPGEYEREGLFIYGIASTTIYGSQPGLNTNYYFELDGIDILALGAHEPVELPKNVLEQVDNVDILILPICGDQVLSPVAAHKLATKLEAKIIIPTGPNNIKDANLQAFNEALSHDLETTDKLSLRSSDIGSNPVAYFIQ
jgi:L-ascorbate metabolism protein UlaG (beta-lactamase superfamily)